MDAVAAHIDCAHTVQTVRAKMTAFFPKTTADRQIGEQNTLLLLLLMLMMAARCAFAMPAPLPPIPPHPRPLDNHPETYFHFVPPRSTLARAHS